jgi:copper transport protein
VLGAAQGLMLMLQAGHARGATVAWPWQPEFILLAATRIGWLGLARIGLAVILAGLLLPRPNRWNRWAGLGFSLLLLLTISLESHAAGEAQPLLPVAADWVHMLAVSVWVGGLFSFLAAMRLVRRQDCAECTRFTAFLIPHFTVLAMSSVGLLVVTGVYASILHIENLDELVSSAYGQALVLKIMIVGLMLAIGAIHFLFTTPRMRRAAAQPGGNPALVKRFYLLLSVEVLLGVIALVWVGVFTTLPPARVNPPGVGFSQSTQADDLTITLSVDPARVGMNTFIATLTSEGKPVSDARDVSLEFSSLSGMVPPSKAAMLSQGNGSYLLRGGYLGMPDQWDIKVVVMRPGKFDAYGDFPLDLSGAGQSMP